MFCSLHVSASKGAAVIPADTSLAGMEESVGRKLLELKEEGVLSALTVTDGELVVALVSPLMLRAHSLP